MDVHTRTLRQELVRRWLTLDVETQESVVMLTRLFTEHSDDATTEGLPHYQEALERQDKAMAQRYTTFGALGPGDKFVWFGHTYQKMEPAKLPLWVNCRGPGGERYLSDGAAVEKVDNESES